MYPHGDRGFLRQEVQSMNLGEHLSTELFQVSVLSRPTIKDVARTGQRKSRLTINNANKDATTNFKQPRR